MSKNSVAHEKQVEHAVWKLLQHPGLSIPNTMVLANFRRRIHVANETMHRAMHQAVRRCQDQALRHSVYVTKTTKHRAYNATINLTMT